MELRNEITINAPARAVWETLGEQFMRMGEWAAPITSSCAVGLADPDVGGTRACTHAALGPFKPGVVKERLTRFDRAQMVLEYDALEGMPRFVAHAANCWSVTRIDDSRSLVRIHARLTLRGPVRLLACLIRWQLQSVGGRVVEELKYFIENGTPHPRKLAASGSPALRGVRLPD